MIEETGTHSWCGTGLNQDYEEDKLQEKGPDMGSTLTFGDRSAVGFRKIY